MRSLSKIISAVLAVVFMLSNLSLIAFAENPSYEGFEYEAVNDEIKIVGYSGSSFKVSIPSEIDSKPVTAIAKEAFKANKIIKSVEIPESVTKIGNYAFALCESLNSVNFGNNITDIGLSAFYGTPLYEASADENGCVYINNCLIHVAKNAGGKPVKEYTVKQGTRLIAQGAFYLDSLTYTDPAELVYDQLTDIIIPSSVDIIDSFAFYGCNNLTTLTLNDGIRKINKRAFEKCDSLSKINLPKTLESIETDLFYACKALEYITVCGNPSIGNNAFDGCPALKEVIFNEGLKRFSLSSFNSCGKLESITLPASVVHFTENTAESCDKLKTIKSYKGSEAEKFAAKQNLNFISLGECPTVFDYDSNNNKEAIITGIYGIYDSTVTIPEYCDGNRIMAIATAAFKANEKIVNLLLPDGITLNDGSFSSCENLRTVILGKENYLGNSFDNCKGIKEVIIPDSEQVISDYCFDSEANITVYGYSGSYAENYAQSNSFEFKDITTAKAPEYYYELLNDEITILSSLNAEDYTPETFAEAEKQLEALNAIYQTDTATAEEIENAVSLAKAAFDKLEISVKLGDTNRDGKISIVDAKYILQNIAGTREFNELAEKSADVNKDGKTSIADAKWVLQMIAGTRDEDGNLTVVEQPQPDNQPTPEIKYDSYLLKVNRTQNIVTVYVKDTKEEYTVPIKAMACSVGLNGKTPTGTYNTTDKYTWRLLSGDVYGQYATRITGHILFHSVPYFTQNKNDLEYLEYNKLGQAASLGCVRLCVRDAKWIYDNCNSGTTVIIYDSLADEPISPEAPIRINVNDSRRGWDPTDPDPNNPWNN